MKNYFYALILISFTTLLGLVMKEWADYHSIGYLYLLNVLIVSAVFGKGPIFFTAALSSLFWNFFFMPPMFSFHIGNTQDMLMCYTYFFVAILGGFLNERMKDFRLLKESARLYQTLFNSISHELRTPMTSILGNAAALQNESALGDKKFVRESTREIGESAERLKQVVDNLLDMSRIESGHLTMKREVFSLDELLDEAISRLHLQLSNHKVVRENSQGDELSNLISGDFKLLDHAIGNLLLNAANYSEKGSEIRVSIRTEGEFIVLNIRDDGPGIKVEYGEKIFEKFFRVPGTRTGGVGLGLSIVKGILDAHSAKIKLVETARGACFEVSFLKANLPENIRNELK